MSFATLPMLPSEMGHLGYTWGVIKSALLHESKLHDISPFMIIHNQFDYERLLELSEYLHIQSKDILRSPIYDLYRYTTRTILEWQSTHSDV